jgi:hypothetical protein|tara:strand:+ start:1179 stop:1649 length:471 start_codon:yes stop_codon:yes gene_type:complete
MVWIAIIIGIILLFAFPKQVGILIAVIVIGSGATYLYFEEQDKQRERQIDAVTITITFDKKSCSQEFPLLVSIINGSKNIVEKISWNIGAHKRGHSNNVVDYGYSSEYSTPYSSDKILNSGQRFSVCYKTPSISGKHLPNELDWSAVRKSISFRHK